MRSRDFIHGGGGPETLWWVWNVTRRISIFANAHLSALFGLVIVAIMAFREFDELKTMAQQPQWLLFVVFLLAAIFIGRYLWLLCVPVKLPMRWHVFYSSITVSAAVLVYFFGSSLIVLAHSPKGPFRLLVLTLSIATVAAAWWEFRGDKVSGSHRDIWFEIAMREAVRELDDLRKKMMAGQDPEKLYGDFLDWVIIYSCETLCGRKKVHAGFFAQPPERVDVLALFNTSPNSNYPGDLLINLRTSEHPPGAAGLAYELTQRGIVYVPYRKKKKAWVHTWAGDKGYLMPSHEEDTWTEIPGQPWFESSLSVPVFFYERDNRSIGRTAGVLAFSTEAPDPFVFADFLMAECFAHLISQALFLKETIQRPS